MTIKMVNSQKLEKYDKKTNIIGDLLLFIMIIAIPAEPIISDLISYAAMAGLLVWTVLKNKKVYFTSATIFMMLFILYSIISLSYTPFNANGSDTVQVMLKMLLYTFTIVQYVFFSNTVVEDGISKVMDFFVIGTVIISVYAMFYERSYIMSSYWRLGKALFENYGTFMLLSYSIIIALLWTFYSLFEKHRFIFIPILVILLLASALSGTKKTIIAVVVSIPVYFFIKYRKRAFKLIFIGIIILAAVYIAYLIIMNNSVLYRTIGYRMQSFINSVLNNGEDSQSYSERYMMRNFAMQWFTDKPVFGNGVSAFRGLYVLKTGKFLYSHCNYTELLCNTGLVGFLSYYGFLIYMLVKSVFLYNKTEKSFFMFATVFMFVVIMLDYGQVSYYRTHYFLIYQLISLALCANKESSSEAVNEKSNEQFNLSEDMI